ncbi:MAG: hypothetical protein ACREDE_11315, partial [Thermoplasmata archaeon]
THTLAVAYVGRIRQEINAATERCGLAPTAPVRAAWDRFEEIWASSRQVAPIRDAYDALHDGLDLNQREVPEF